MTTTPEIYAPVRIIRMEKNQALGLVKDKKSLETVLCELSAHGYAPVSMFPTEIKSPEGKALGSMIICLVVNVTAKFEAVVTSTPQIELPLAVETRPDQTPAT
jgi:hypothetical protein